MSTFTVSGLSSYGTDESPARTVSFEGSARISGDRDSATATVTVVLDPYDVAFALCAFIDQYGIGNVRAAVDRIEQDDPTGQQVGLSAPGRILQGTPAAQAG
jgi:hypothetical protein